MSALAHNMHVRTNYSYHQACTNAVTAQHYLHTRNALAAFPVTAPAQAVTATMRDDSRVTVLPEILDSPKLHMHTSVGRPAYSMHMQVNDGCICVLCEHRFAQEMHNVHQVEERARDFCNGAIRGDYCTNCLQSGGIMRLSDVNGQNLRAIRELLVDLINKHTLAISIKGVINN